MSDVSVTSECRSRSASTAQLQDRIDSLTAAVVSRQQIGWVTGLLSGCLGLSSAQAWQLLARLSQVTNAKVHRVAALLEAARDGRLPAAGDRELADQLRAILGTTWDQLMATRDAP